MLAARSSRLDFSDVAVLRELLRKPGIPFVELDQDQRSS